MKLSQFSDLTNAPVSTKVSNDASVVAPIYFRFVMSNQLERLTAEFLRRAYGNPNILHHPLYNPARYIPIVYESCLRYSPPAAVIELFELYVDNTNSLPPKCMKASDAYLISLGLPFPELVCKFKDYLLRFGVEVLEYNYFNIVDYLLYWNNSPLITHTIEQYFVDRPALTKHIYTNDLYAGANHVTHNIYSTQVVININPPTHYVKSPQGHDCNVLRSVQFALGVIAMFSNMNVKQHTIDDYIDRQKLFNDLDKHDLWMYFALKLFCLHRQLHNVNGWKQIVSGIVPTLLVRMCWPDYHIALGTAITIGGRAIWDTIPGIEQFVESYDRLC